MNKNKPSIKKNFIYNTLYQLVNVLTPLITAPYISRVLGADGIGVQSYISSIQAYFLLFATLGTMSYGAREISMNRDDPYKRSKLFWEIELMTVATSVITIIVWAGLVFFSAEYKTYYIVLTLGIVAALFDITWFFNGIEQFKIISFRNIIFKLIGVVCMFLFVKTHEDLGLYILINSLMTLFSSLSVWPLLKKYLIKVNPAEFRFRYHFCETLVYFIPTIATSIYTVLDRTLIGLITHEATENGYYQQAQKIIEIAKTIVFYSINSVVGVRISYLYAEKQYEEIRTKITESFHYIFFMGYGCCFGIMAVAKTFVPMFLGPGYDEVVTLLYIFSPIIIIIGISNCLGCQYYSPCGKRAQSARYIVAGAVLNLLLNSVLIPGYSAAGAAIASIMAELFITILYIHFSETYGSFSLLVKVGYKKLISGIVMFVVVFSMNELTWNPVILVCVQIIAGVVIYGFMLLILQDVWVLKYMKKIHDRFRKAV